MTSVRIREIVNNEQVIRLILQRIRQANPFSVRPKKLRNGLI